MLAGSESVVLNFEAAGAIELFETQTAGARLSVAHDVGHALAHGQRKHAFLHCRNFYGGGGIALHGQAGGLKRGFRLREFGDEPLGAVSANSVAHIGQCLARDFFDFVNFFGGALRIAVDQLSGEF